MQRTADCAFEPDPRERALGKTLGLPELVARVLLARGLDDPERAKAFLRPDLRTLADPFLFTDMRKAVARIREALQHGQPILIHGDYDVDGISGTVLLHKFFNLLSATSKAYVPARTDGYSISPASVAAIRQGGYPLVISVDNGTNAVASVTELQAAGIDVIITDHHGTSDNVAPAFAVLNPRLPGAGYPDRDLAGCGVAFRLAAALAESFTHDLKRSPEFAEFLADAMAYVALGTIADVAPLNGENRVMVHHGLRSLAQSRNPGIRALLDSAGLSHRGIDASDIAFRVAPLINAAGRVSHAKEAFDVLCATGFSEAQAAAKQLESHNVERRRLERQLHDEAMAMAMAEPGPAVVLGSEHWHPGVIGIVAARIAETVHKPTFLVSFRGSTGRGSGRCTTGLHLRHALARCSELLISHGGHAAAAGVEVAREQFAAFRERFQQVCLSSTPEPEPLQVDGGARFAELDPNMIRRLAALGPFGRENSPPRFCTRAVRFVGQPTTDPRGIHLRVRAVDGGTILPVRILHGGKRFEEIRSHQGGWTLVYSPRLASRAEDGPVVLEVSDLQPETLSP